MKEVILGANSYLGARLYYDLRNSYETIGTYHQNPLSNEFIELDITRPEEVESFFKTQRPNIIIHVANSANARWCEAHPEEAKQLNQVATGSIVDAANQIGAKIIYISSFAAITPENVYGQTKRAAEELVKGTKAGYVILRPSLILGFSPNTTNDRPFNRLLKNLDEKTPARYDTSWKFQPTYIRHISEVIRQIIEQNITGETIPVAIAEMKSRYDTASDILTPFGIAVTAINAHDTTVSLPQSLRKLSTLHLPVYTYDQMIQEIINEIKHREVFKLS